MARLGLDWRPYLYSTNRDERLLEVAVAVKAADMIHRDREIERDNLANLIGNRVGRIVGRAMAELARALR